MFKITFYFFLHTFFTCYSVEQSFPPVIHLKDLSGKKCSGNDLFEEDYMKRLLALLIALSAIISFLPAYAAEPAGQQPQGVTQSTSAFTIGEIVVRDKAVPNIEDASTTTEISGEDIAARSDRSLADSLKMVPGMNVTETAKGFTGFNMRGFNHDRVAIMVDGLPILDPYYGGSNIDISTINVQNVQRVIVNRGTASALYGALGSIGSINVITKRPEKLYAEANAEYAQHNNYTINAAAGAPMGNFYAWITASVQNSDGYEVSRKLDYAERKKWFDKLVQYGLHNTTFEQIGLSAAYNYLNDTGVWNHTAYTKYNASGRFGYNFTNDIEAGLSISWYSNEQRSNTFSSSTLSSYDPNPTKTPFYNWSTYTSTDYAAGKDSNKAPFQNRSFVWDEDTRYSISPYFTADLGDLTIRANMFYIFQRNDLLGWFDQAHTTMFPPSTYYYNAGKSKVMPYSGENVHSIYQETSYGFNIMPSYKIASWNRLFAAIHWRVENHKKIESAYDDLATNVIAIHGTGEYNALEMEASYLTLALEDQMSFNTIIGRVALSAGISYDAQNFTDFEARSQANDSTMNQMVDQYIASDDNSIWGTRDSFNPVFGVVYDPIKDFLRIRASFAMKTKFPSLAVYKDITSTTVDYRVDPERIYSTNAGFELFFLNNAVSFRNDYFYTRVNNKIENIYNPDASTRIYTNIDGYVVQGIESTVQGLFQNIAGIMDIKMALSYTYTHARNYDDSYVTLGETVAETPVHQYTAQIICDFITKTRLMLWGTMIRNQVVYTMSSLPPQATNQTFTREYYSTTRLHDPIMLNIKLQQEFMGHFNVYVMCKNILDDYNADPFNPGPGRMFYFGGGARL